MSSAFLLILALCVGSVVPAQARRHGKSPDECAYTDSFGVHYDLSKLSNPPSGAYSFQTESETVYFNLCGNVSKAADSPCLGSDAAVCVVPSNGSSVNAGKASSMVFSDSEVGFGLVMTYLDGDACNASGVAGTRRAVLNFACPTGPSNVGLGMTSYEEIDDCTVVLNLTSVYVCPNDGGRSIIFWIPVVMWLVLLACCALCCACCVACARRCRARQEVKEQMEKIMQSAPAGSYAPVPTAEPIDLVAPASTTVVALEDVPPPYSAYYNPVVYAPQYQQQYQQPYQQQYPAYASYASYPPVVRPLAEQPVAPSAPVRAPATVAPATASDEQLARALQQEYDKEGSLL